MHGELALIDGDLWTYDIAFAAQRKLEDGTVDIMPFEYCQQLVHKRLEEVLQMANCTSYEGYLTGEGNFRFNIAKTVPYKGTRTQEKPWHYENIRNYLEGALGFKVVHGMEADDMLAIRQLQEGDNSTIISRDKDLRMVPGWHFGYPCGKQKAFGPMYYDDIGTLNLKGVGSKKKIEGGGLKFFYAQLIMGDRTDNILGIPLAGDVLAFNTLNDLLTEEEMFQAVWELYYKHYGELNARERMLEDGQLLWMTRELQEDGTPVLWQFPFEPKIPEEPEDD